MEDNTVNYLIGFTQNLRLLYAEDNEDIRHVTFELLKEFFSDIEVAVNGQDALEKYNNKVFDLVITDIDMPIMTGLELAAQIRKTDKDIPIIVSSACNESEYFLQSIKMGVDGYLLKPIDIDQFMNVLLKVSKHIFMQLENLEYKNSLELKVVEKTKELGRAYSHDRTTGLPNFLQLTDALNSKKYTYLILLDISDFTLMNKEYGRLFANKILEAIGKELSFHLDKRKTLFKVESDRFVVLSSDENIESIKNFCDQINSYFDHVSIEIGESEVHVGFCMGIAKIKQEANAIIEAEYALESCKSVGKRFYHLFDSKGDTVNQEVETIRWLKVTKQLIEEGLIEPFFQPIKDIKTNKITKYEVLARGIWDDEILLPSHFIASAQRLGLITSITKMMIDKSFIFFKNIDMDFSINITERDLLDNYLIDFLTKKIHKYGIEASRVTLEVLESIAIKHSSDNIILQLNELRKIGFKIAIDDFGVENSNLSRLLDIDIDIIKLDGVFIKNMVTSEKDRKITKAIVLLAKALDIEIVVEYVNSSEIYELIKEYGVDSAQGYFIGKPQRELLEIN